MFRVQFLSITMPKDWHPKLKTWTRRCLLAADIAVTAYISDIKTNVRALVQVMIDDERASDEQSDHDTARQRKRYLNTWCRADFPLGYGDHIYPALLRAITPAGEVPALKSGNNKAMSTLELSSLICEIVSTDKPLPLQAPLIAKSASLSVFRVVIPFIIAQAQYNIAPDPHAFAIYALAQIFDDHHVAHVPWSPPNNHNLAGRPARKVDFNYWRMTSKSQEVGQRALMKVVDAQEHLALSDARLAQNAALRNGKAPWAIHSMTIADLPSVLHKICIPDDFDLADASLSRNDEGFITATYDWVYSHYDGADPIHLFALMVAHIFSRMAPNLGHPDMPPSAASLKGNSSAITAIVRRAPWTFDRRRGVSASQPFIVMVSTFIIAILDPKSPLRRYMSENDNSLGDWSKKHGARPLRFIGYPYAHFCMLVSIFFLVIICFPFQALN